MSALNVAPVDHSLPHEDDRRADHLRLLLAAPAESLRQHAGVHQHQRLGDLLGVGHRGPSGLVFGLDADRNGIDEALQEDVPVVALDRQAMIEIVRRVQRNVKNWSGGDMRLRWTAAGWLEAERQFRKIIGYRDLANLAVAVEREVARSRPSPPPAASREEVRQAVTV